jgi:hypothetical protein
MLSSIIAASDSDGGGISGLWLTILIISIVLVIAGWWKIFEKAGEDGWKAIIPIYNIIILLKITGRPIWWVVLLLIPCVSLIVYIIVANDLSKSFGKSTGFTVGLVLLSPIFALILGFGDAKYLGPAGPEGAGGTPPPPPPPPAPAS